MFAKYVLLPNVAKARSILSFKLKVYLKENFDAQKTNDTIENYYNALNLIRQLDRLMTEPENPKEINVIREELGDLIYFKLNIPDADKNFIIKIFEHLANHRLQSLADFKALSFETASCSPILKGHFLNTAREIAEISDTLTADEMGELATKRELYATRLATMDAILGTAADAKSVEAAKVIQTRTSNLDTAREEALTDLRNENAELKRRIEEQAAHLASLSALVSKKETEITSLREEIANLQAQVAEHQKIKNDFETYKSLIKDFEGLINTQSTLLTDANSKLAAKETELTSLREEKDKLLATEVENHEKTKSGIAELKDIITSLQATIARQEEFIRLLRTQYDDLSKQYSEALALRLAPKLALKNLVAHTETATHSIQEQVNSFNAQMREALVRAINVVKDYMTSSYRSHLNRVNDENAQLRSQIAAAMKQIKHLEQLLSLVIAPTKGFGKNTDRETTRTSLIPYLSSATEGSAGDLISAILSFKGAASTGGLDTARAMPSRAKVDLLSPTASLTSGADTTINSFLAQIGAVLESINNAYAAAYATSESTTPTNLGLPTEALALPAAPIVTLPSAGAGCLSVGSPLPPPVSTYPAPKSPTATKPSVTTAGSTTRIGTAPNASAPTPTHTTRSASAGSTASLLSSIRSARTTLRPASERKTPPKASTNASPLMAALTARVGSLRLSVTGHASSEESDKDSTKIWSPS